uniref:protein sidekick-2-like n=1 Tax=Myxine glutinosa TaxID=7769 RepID=UPI00358EEDB3
MSYMRLDRGSCKSEVTDGALGQQLNATGKRMMNRFTRQDLRPASGEHWLHLDGISTFTPASPPSSSVTESEDCQQESNRWDAVLHLGSTTNKQGQASSRLSVLPPGSLLISPVLLTDAGNYICVARNYRGEASARARLVVWARTRITEAPRDRGVVRGRSVELRCEVAHDPAVSASVSWIKDGEELGAAERARLLRGGPDSLRISHATPADSGAYTCLVTSSAGNDSRTARVEVRELPGPPQAPGVRVSAAGRRLAELGWAHGYDGNSALVRYVLETSVDDSAWRVLVSNLAPESTTALSPALKPGHSYRFRLIAANAVGPGEPSIETDSLVLQEEPPERSPQHLTVSERSNHSLSLCWQPPEVDYWNGPLKGYLIRFRASGAIGDFQFKNIPSPAMTAMTIPELHPWQTYEAAIAAYNSAGLGPYSAPLVQRTLEGVPLTAPARVQLRSLNSTSVRVAWSQPDSHKLRGTLLGYKVEVWRPGLNSESLNVDVPPEPPGVGRVAQVTGLLAYTDYAVTVRCTTSAGNGPSSAPRRVRTHEDTPGPVQGLQLLDFSKTSLLLSWSEPKELNGVLFGYQLSWQQGNRTHVIVTHNLDNSFHKYRITGLEEHASYLLRMAARTSAGSGPVRSLTFTAGHIPAVPRAPVVLSVSRVMARSLLLQVRSGPERGTSITHWIVEAQTGLTDKGGNWTVLHEMDAKPQKYSLLVNELQPYTFYRLRVRQGTAVAVSEASPATRWVQTLPAPPDVAPWNITVRTAGSRSIWVHWAPLAVEDYQAIPESVGYRVRCKHKEFPTSLPLDATTDDGGEREASLEGLHPFSTYMIQVQAFNANGPGPWTEVVEAKTSEAAPSAGPMDVYANATSPSAILVGWGMVPKQDHNGQILGFKVLYQAVGTNLPPSLQKVRGAAAGCVLLTGLRVFTEYTVQVQAFNRAGDGAATSSTALIRTHDDVPGPPTMIFFPEVHPTSVLMTWQPPENPNGVVLAYRVSFWLDVSSHRAFSVVQLGADTRRFTTSDLVPESIYRFRMVARTDVGWGEPAEVVVVTTESRARPDPPGKPSVPRAGVAARSVTLTWTPGSDHSAPLRYYIVQARVLPGEPRWEAVAPSLPPGLTSYTLDR